MVSCASSGLLLFSSPGSLVFSFSGSLVFSLSGSLVFSLSGSLVLRNCANNRNSEVKNYFNLCQNMVKNLKQLKYGRILFSKYQMKNFNCVLNTFLNGFVNECLR